MSFLIQFQNLNFENKTPKKDWAYKLLLFVEFADVVKNISSLEERMCLIFAFILPSLLGVQAKKICRRQEMDHFNNKKFFSNRKLKIGQRNAIKFAQERRCFCPDEFRSGRRLIYTWWDERPITTLEFNIWDL